MKRFCMSVVLPIVFVLISHFSFAQRDHKNNYWLGVGLGKSQFPSGMMALGYEFSNRPTLIVARYTANSEILPDIRPAIRVDEFALLYGIRTGKFRFSTGLSGVWGRNRGQFLWADPDPLIYGSAQHETISYTTIGLPAEIRFITSNKDVGIGVTGFGNLNAKRSFAGINLSLYIGQMKK
ncbi:MAG: hypothetical protein EOP45_09900 [Sphingobacteriaceae bacterium]|nr:MAG: hypothetical protein EOP45_09900 [Sphingobacteriaceae bacterium]